MASRKEKGMELFMQGYNCSQAVVLAFADVLGTEWEQAARMSASFGGGLARLRHVCGTVSGMSMVAGMMTASSDPKNLQKKKENYETVQKLAKEFEKRNGSIICRELLGIGTDKTTVGKEYETGAEPEPRTKEYYDKRPCKELVGEACEILEELLFQNS
ncbi:MAG: C-GCAxxG-C-C family protein [Roseburia sp.]|nr:C-GCAxxG-C-C family protein [Roseburia sp.]